MATVNLKDLNPVVFLNNMALGADFVPDEKLVIKGGNIKLEHDNTGQGIQFKSSVNTGNKSNISWYNSSNTQKWRLVNDESADKTDDIRLISSTVTALAAKQDGKVSIGTASTDSSAMVTVNSADNNDTYLSFRKDDTDKWRVGSNSANNFVIKKSHDSSDKDIMSIASGGASTLLDSNIGVGLPSVTNILAQRASTPTSTSSQLLTVKGEARFFQDDPYDSGFERGIVLSWDMDDNTGVIDTTDSTTNLEFAIGGNTKYILEDGGTAGKSAGTEGWIQVNLGTRSAPKRGYIRVYTAK